MSRAVKVNEEVKFSSMRTRIGRHDDNFVLDRDNDDDDDDDE